MTYEEALDDVLMYCIENCGKLDTCMGENKTCAEAVVIHVLKKRIPQKPYESEGSDEYNCPVCGATYALLYDGEMRYCPDCGQALDWS